MSSRDLSRWIRELHLYLGLFLSPLVLVFAISVLLLNHGHAAWGGDADRQVERLSITVAVPEEENGLELARHIRRRIEEQTGMSGEIGWVTRDEERNRFGFPLEKPGELIQVRVDLASGMVELERTRTGVWDAMVYLHTMPGPHLVAIRGNWIFSLPWKWVADATVYLLLFLTVSGVYLWTLLRAERRTGLIVVGSGFLSFVAIILALVA